MTESKQSDEQPTLTSKQPSASSPNLLSPEGTVHIGHYEFDTKEMLGHGAYGTVFKGRKSFDGGPVALKRVPSGVLREVEVDSPIKTKSPYIVDCLDVVTDQTADMTYVVLELCDTDLRNFLCAYGHLSDENLDLVSKCLAEGYWALRKNSVVHRDIKPENIMLKLDQPPKIENQDNENKEPKVGFHVGDVDTTTDVSNNTAINQKFHLQPRINVAKFGDFGCSRNDSDTTQVMQNLAGTLDYMAPEVGANIVESHSYDYSVDMWSIGVVLYECVNGKTPFDERQLCKLFLRATEGNFASYEPPKLTGCAEAYSFIIGALLELDPSRRLTPEEFRDAVFGRPNNGLIKKLARTFSVEKHKSKEKRALKNCDKLNKTTHDKSVGAFLSRIFSFIVK